MIGNIPKVFNSNQFFPKLNQFILTTPFCLVRVGYHSELRVAITMFYQHYPFYQRSYYIVFFFDVHAYVIYVHNDTLTNKHDVIAMRCISKWQPTLIRQEQKVQCRGGLRPLIDSYVTEPLQ
jgi:hypothetical protein